MPISDGFKNLRPVHDSVEASKRGKAGAIASLKTKRRKQSLKECLEVLLSMPRQDGEGETNAQAVAIALLERAIAGNVRAIECLRDSTEGKPAMRAEITTPQRCKLVLFSDEVTEQAGEDTDNEAQGDEDGAAQR